MRTLWLTQEDNVKDRKVIDGDKIIIEDFQNNVMVSVEGGNKKIDIDIANISLFNHKLIIDGKKYYILHMLSK